MLAVLLVLVAALGLAVLVYWGLERLGRRGVMPTLLRGVAWLALGLLLIDLSCARPAASVRPLVLLDASLSMAAPGGRWREALAAAGELGEVRLVGSLGPDSLPVGGRSEVAGPLVGAAALGRPLWLLSDGEVNDAALVPPDLWQRVGVRTFVRPVPADLALVRVEGPDRIAVGDTLRLRIDVAGFGGIDRTQANVEVRSGGARWMSGPVKLAAGAGSTTLETRISEGMGPGPHLLEVAIRDAADADSLTDLRLFHLIVLPTPGIVVVASPGDWESRFLFRTLSEVAALPIRGFLGLDDNRWVRMGELDATPPAEVARAVERADVVITMGDRAERLGRAGRRAHWRWLGSSVAAAPQVGDWYLAAGAASPVSGAFIGFPVDSFPPSVALAPLLPSPGDFIVLTAQQNRRGVERPAALLRDSAGRREALVATAGLWRWAFRGGSSDQAYRAWAASTLTWLLGGGDSATGRARPLRPVVERGRPVVFERLRADTAPLVVELTGPDGGRRVDTLRFDGAGRAGLDLLPGQYAYRLVGGGRGLLGVEQFSQERLPHPVVLADRVAAGTTQAGEESLRDRWWLFGLAIVALSGEWWWRRRAGLR